MSEPVNIEITELSEIQLPLVNRFYKEARYSSKAGRGERVFVARNMASPAKPLVAAVRLQEKAPGWWFLRAMCVAPELRGQGVGRQLLEGLTDFLAERSCFCYPFEHLADFYAAIGFVLVDADMMAQQPAFMREPFERYTRQGRKIRLMQRPGDH